MSIINSLPELPVNISAKDITGGILDFKPIGNEDKPLLKFPTMKPSDETQMPASLQKAPACISGYTLPESIWATGKHYSDEEVAVAQETYANLTPQEQADMQKAYEKAINEYNRAKSLEATRCGIAIMDTLTMDEFLAENPEFKQACAVMGPIAQDYNDHLTEVANEYIENAPLGEKILLKLGIPTPGMKAAMEHAKVQYQIAYMANQQEKPTNEQETEGENEVIGINVHDGGEPIYIEY